MAIDKQVYGVNVKQQSVLGLLGMLIITLGIYGLFWIYRVNREMRDFGKVYGDQKLASVNPALSVLAVFVPIVNLVGLHRIGTRVIRVQELTGRGANYSMAVHWILAIFTGLWYLYVQSALTSLYVWIDTANRAPVAPAAPAEPAVAVGTGGPFVG